MITTVADGIGKKTTPKESDAARSCSAYLHGSGWPCSGGEEVVVGVEDEGKALRPHDIVIVAYSRRRHHDII